MARYSPARSRWNNAKMTKRAGKFKVGLQRSVFFFIAAPRYDVTHD
jgi:hypothetical protein